MAHAAKFRECQGSTPGFGGFQTDSLVVNSELMQTCFIINQNRAMGNL